MLDLKAWADDSPLYFSRLRSKAIPNGVAEYGDEPKGGGGKSASKPPISLGALEASERESVALWRVLAHYGAEAPYNPFMRGQGRRVVGMKMCDEPEFVVSCMADDVVDCVNLSGPGEVASRTLSFCHKAREGSKMIVGDLSRADTAWISQDAAIAEFGLNRKMLWWRRERNLVEFRTINGEFHYRVGSLCGD